MATMGKNGANAKRLLGALIPKLYREIVVMERTEECGLAVEGPMKGVAGLKGVSRMSITTKPEARDEEVMKKLAWLNIV